jgi:hypothetical protein
MGMQINVSEYKEKKGHAPLPLEIKNWKVVYNNWTFSENCSYEAFRKLAEKAFERQFKTRFGEVYLVA